MKYFKRILLVMKITFVLFTSGIVLFSLFSSFLFNRAEGAGFLGYQFFAVLSNSMQPEFEAGDVVVTKKVDLALLNEGDIIAFYSSDPKQSGQIITHQIEQVIQLQGKRAYITRGMQTNASDPYPVPSDFVIGIYCSRLPKAGYLFQFLKSPPGYLCLVLLPLLLISSFQGIRFFRLLKKAKADQENERLLQQQILCAKYQEIDCALRETLALNDQLRALLSQSNPKGGQ